MQDLSFYFRALADRKRLTIVEYLAGHDEVTVTQLGEELRFSQPLISWHLRKLRRAGLVKTRRSGRQVWCSLNLPAFHRYHEKLEELLAQSNQPSESAERQPLQQAGHL